MKYRITVKYAVRKTIFHKWQWREMTRTFLSPIEALRFQLNWWNWRDAHPRLRQVPMPTTEYIYDG
jgi:hypothetical protein